MRILVAPFELKGSLTATRAAHAIASGIRTARPGWTIDALPLSDGGPGFLDALAQGEGWHRVPATTRDALLRPVPDAVLLIDSQHETAYVESSMAIGLTGIGDVDRAPLRASSEGVGQLLEGAIEAGARCVVIGVGGSATTDGGSGMARALGARFLDIGDSDLAPGGGALAELARIEWAPPSWLDAVEVVVATDVTAPLTGPLGAARVFAPQKGATPPDVGILERGLERYAAVVHESLGVDIATVPGGGAAGGLAAGLVAFAGARIEAGFDIVASATSLRDRMLAADAVVTAEGRFDAQSTMGKGTGRITAMAAELRRLCVVFAGSSSVDSTMVRTLAAVEPDLATAMADAERLLATLAEWWAREA